jgi:hypothetical protein
VKLRRDFSKTSKFKHFLLESAADHEQILKLKEKQTQHKSQLMYIPKVNLISTHEEQSHPVITTGYTGDYICCHATYQKFTLLAELSYAVACLSNTLLRAVGNFASLHKGPNPHRTCPSLHIRLDSF